MLVGGAFDQNLGTCEQTMLLCEVEIGRWQNEWLRGSDENNLVDDVFRGNPILAAPSSIQPFFESWSLLC